MQKFAVGSDWVERKLGITLIICYIFQLVLIYGDCLVILCNLYSVSRSFWRYGLLWIFIVIYIWTVWCNALIRVHGMNADSDDFLIMADVLLDMPDVLDISYLRGAGKQPDEEELADAATPAAPGA